MSDEVGTIQLVDVWKSFRLYRSRSLKEVMIHVARREPIVDRRPILKGVTLSVASGERLAIVGKNGAGKSTLFRVLSGILVPDRGVARALGRVAPLIEVTAGFVPDLTGAENLRLNAAILGLSREEIDARYDEIVRFAEVGDFMATPVRYFSSGMQTRLGFAIVAHVDADIVLIDEALAVGDVAFQRRCIEKMEEISDRGATVVFISHDFEAVKQFCRRAVWLDDGIVKLDGPTDDVVAAVAAAL